MSPSRRARRGDRAKRTTRGRWIAVASVGHGSRREARPKEDAIRSSRSSGGPAARVMLALRASRTFAVTGFLTVCAVGDAARAQGGAEPITVAYEAPNECPDADAFFREVAARTTHARAAKPGDRARRLHVVVARRGHVYAGKLWIEETETSSSAREVIGAAC